MFLASRKRFADQQELLKQFSSDADWLPCKRIEWNATIKFYLDVERRLPFDPGRKLDRPHPICVVWHPIDLPSEHHSGPSGKAFNQTLLLATPLTPAGFTVSPLFGSSDPCHSSLLCCDADWTTYGFPVICKALQPKDSSPP